MWRIKAFHRVTIQLLIADLPLHHGQREAISFPLTIMPFLSIFLPETQIVRQYLDSCFQTWWFQIALYHCCPFWSSPVLPLFLFFAEKRILSASLAVVGTSGPSRRVTFQIKSKFLLLMSKDSLEKAAIPTAGPFSPWAMGLGAVFAPTQLHQEQVGSLPNASLSPSIKQRHTSNTPRFEIYKWKRY